jgi:ABC-type uncharacterized transport system substrate-binding protein
MAASVLPRRLPGLVTFALLGGLVAACAKGGDQGAAAKPDSASAGTAAAAAPRTVAIIRAADWIGAEWSEDALRVGLSEEGLEKDRDYTFKLLSAQGDLATLPSLVDAAVDQKAAVIVTLQDETLKSAIERVKDIPIVFHVLADPFAAGAGTSDSNHAANVTGVYSPGFGDPEQERRVALIKRVAPSAKKIGILFTPGEALSVQLKDKMAVAAKKGGLGVEAMPINNPGEGTEAVNALLAKNVGAIEIFGNPAHAAFESIIAAANAKKVPVFSPSPFEIMKGASAAIFPDFQEGGVVAGHMIGRILKGESPANMPFYRLETSKEQVAGK